MECEAVDKKDNSFSENEHDEEGDRLILPMRKTCSFFVDTSPTGSISKDDIENDDHMDVEKIQSEVYLNVPKLNDSFDTNEKKKKYSRKKKNVEENGNETSKKNERELKKIQRLKNKELKDKERALKKACSENSRCLKPGECMKVDKFLHSSEIKFSFVLPH